MVPKGYIFLDLALPPSQVNGSSRQQAAGFGLHRGHCDGGAVQVQDLQVLLQLESRVCQSLDWRTPPAA